MSRPLALSTVALLLLANLAVAQRPDRARPRPQREPAIRVEGEATVKSVRRLSMVLGANVALHGGRAVGPVEDIVLNEDGCIEYVVVRYEDKFLPVPWTILAVNFDERVIVLDIDEARLTRAPMFAGEDWSVLIEADWSGRVTTYYQADRRRPDRDRGDGPNRRARPRGEDRDDNEAGDDNPRRPADDATPGERPTNDDPDEAAEDGEEQPTTPADDAAPADDVAPAEEGGSEAPAGEAGEGAELPETPQPSPGEPKDD